MVSTLKFPADNYEDQSKEESLSDVPDIDSTAVEVYDPEICTSCITILHQGIVADVDIEPNVVVSELFGEVGTQAKYKADRRNTYFMSLKPNQFVFFFQSNFIHLYLDARASQHNSRYLKSTNDPNGRIALLGSTQADAESTLKCGIVTTRQIRAGEAITIGRWRPSMTIEVVRTCWSSNRNSNGAKLKTVKQLCIWHPNSARRRFTRKLVWNERNINAVENTIIKVGSNSGLGETWNQALYDLGFKDFDGWYSDGVTGVEIQTKGKSDVPTLSICKDEEETINYPLVREFCVMYPRCNVVNDHQYEVVRILTKPIVLVSYGSIFHALKIIQEPDDLELFLNEVFAMTKLSNSPYVTRLTAFASMANPYDPNGNDVVCGVLTEFSEKGDLRVLLDVEGVKNLPWHLKLKWAKEIALGVQDIHSLDLVHGDLKCHNVVIDARDNAKILDVGSGGMTHGYFWPSDANCEPLLPSFDIYSVGVVFWELSDGGTPSFCSPPVVSELKCPQGYAELVQKCVAESSSDRPLISEVISQIIYMEESHRLQRAGGI